jgi:hypothetical protein
MRMRYTPLFAIECLHDYYADGICRPLSLRPTPDCLGLLERHQCLFRAKAGGGMVASASRDEVDLLAGYGESAPFSFELISADPRLTHRDEQVTPPPAGMPGERLRYFNNLGAGGMVADGELAAEWLPVRGKRFSHRLEPSHEEARVEVVDTLRGEPVWCSARLAPGARVIPLDLGALPDGRYRFRIGDDLAPAFYLSDLPAAGRWGVVEIFPGGALAAHVPANHRVLDEAGQPRPKTFVIRLDNPGSIWRYFIIDHNAEDHAYDGHRVEGYARPASRGTDTRVARIEFTELARTRVEGRPARVFESTRPIALRERPGDDYEFLFKANGQGERSGPTFRLPYASAETTRLETVSGVARMCSEIFVYL